MATRFYLHNDAAPYTPATIRGAWDASGSAVTKRIDASKLPATTSTYVQVAETSAVDEYDVLLYRGVSGPLAAGTIGTGTVNVMLGVYEQNAAANCHYHLHIYVTQGDSDTPRGTLLTDYREGAGVNEWATDYGACAKALNAAQALSSLAVSAGDRIVIEIGFAARNTVTTSYYGGIGYGGGRGTRDQVVGDAYNVGFPYIEFSETLPGTATNRISQGPVETLLAETTITGRISQGPVETLLAETTITGRISQGPVEVLMTDDANPARVSQVVAEALQTQTSSVRVSQAVLELVNPSIVQTRVSQIVAELLYPTVIESRVSQAVAEILNTQLSPIRVSQVVIEMLAKVSTYCGEPSLSPATLCGKPDVLAWLEWTVPLREN
jgi:hypothetical protein